MMVNLSRGVTKTNRPKIKFKKISNITPTVEVEPKREPFQRRVSPNVNRYSQMVVSVPRRTNESMKSTDILMQIQSSNMEMRFQNCFSPMKGSTMSEGKNNVRANSPNTTIKLNNIISRESGLQAYQTAQNQPGTEIKSTTSPRKKAEQMSRIHSQDVIRKNKEVRAVLSTKTNLMGKERKNNFRNSSVYKKLISKPSVLSSKNTDSHDSPLNNT
jgi:hypothetical protein